MKKLLLLALLPSITCFSQLTEARMCEVSRATNPVYSTEAAKKENDAFEAWTAEFVKNKAAKTFSGECYVIPIVFHVYGTTQGGKTVSNSLIINAVQKMNDDYHGLNNDYNTVHNNFFAIRDIMPDLTFALAQKDPSGNATTGIMYHPVAAGFANGTGYDAQIQADAWDNYKYMNIYIMNDLFNNGVTNNSGYGYYPNTTMSNNNTARIVYNGAYLGTNTNQEFASTLSHEYGHWLNLIHTFDGGCVQPNDYVTDTPPCDYSNVTYTCHATPTSTYPVNCNNELINAENYMDYSGAYGCYKMFTQGQVARMYAGLQHPSRQPLWQLSNLIAVGLGQLCSPTNVTNLSLSNSSFIVYPNPAGNSIYIKSADNMNGSTYKISDQLGRELLNGKLNSQNESIDVSALPTGVYFLTAENNGRQILFRKIVKE